MRFEHKAAIQQFCSRVPGGESLNFFLQRYVTRVIPRHADGFANKVRRASQHLGHLRRLRPALRWGDARLLEVGAGYDWIIPLTYAMCGIGQQSLIDFMPRIRLELINNTLRRIEAFRPELESTLQCTTRSVGPPVKYHRELADRLGIHFYAPLDARDTRLPAGSIDYITSTSTLEHFESAHLAPTLREWRRLLTPEGLVSCHIDLKDHFRQRDGGITVYNFLKFSPQEWERYNPRLLYQNRLRAPEYVALFTAEGYTILTQERDEATEADLADLRKMTVHPDFQHFPFPDLGVKILWLVAAPQSGSVL